MWRLPGLKRASMPHCVMPPAYADRPDQPARARNTISDHSPGSRWTWPHCAAIPTCGAQPLRGGRHRPAPSRTPQPRPIASRSDGLVVIGDHYGALTLGAAARFGAHSIRTHQDPLTGERALRRNADRFGLAGHYRSLPLTPGLVKQARRSCWCRPRRVGPELIGDSSSSWPSMPRPERPAAPRRPGRSTSPGHGDVPAGDASPMSRAGPARQKSRVISAQGVRG